MSTFNASLDQPLTTRKQLLDPFIEGNKTADTWKIGTEHEKFVFNTHDLSAALYDGAQGISALLQSLTRFGWSYINENGKVIGLHRAGANITLEPAGQLELSGAPLSTVHDTRDELLQHFDELYHVAPALGLDFFSMGFQPKYSRSQLPWVPKQRYQIMRRYMPTVGSLGLDMMSRTCTVQVNLDYADEADMVQKFRIAMALQPLATALFADSPFTEGKPNGYLSYRAFIWQHTDSHRTGQLDFVFDEGFGFERYVDYLLNVPMYFVYRNGKYYDVAGASFADWMAGRLSCLPGEVATRADWQQHMTTAFPDVRLKSYLEMRGADSGTMDRLCALPAFWVGLLYDTHARDAAWDLVKAMTKEQRHALHHSVPKHALDVPYAKGTVRDLAREVLAIARSGLSRRAQCDALGQDETQYLDVLDQIVDSGITPAKHKLDLFYSKWSQNVDPIFSIFSYAQTHRL